MSSRLFQKIREELGLAYTVYSAPSAYANNGAFTVYLGTSPQHGKKAVEAIRGELNKFVKEGITDEEFQRGKELLKGALILSQESTSSIMNVYGKYMLLTDALFDIDKRIENINKVTLDEIRESVDYVFDFKNASGVYVGRDPFDVLEVLNDR
jgi:predicted Zn-dependent peptidase